MKAARRKAVSDNRGMAMLLCLTVLLLLITGAVELNRRARYAVETTAFTRDRTTMAQMGTAAVHAAMALLVEDKRKTQADSYQEEWADPAVLGEVLGTVHFDRGTVGLTISDEMGLIQVNALVDFPKGRSFNVPQMQMWDRIARLLKMRHEAFEEIDPTEIYNSVKDWLDRGDDDFVSGTNGAESDWYLDNRNPPYESRNGPIPHIGELLMIKGITPELYNGVPGIPGMSTYMTVFGMTDAKGDRFSFPGKININTAPLPVLIAVLPEQPDPYETLDAAQAMIDYRNEKSDGVFVHSLKNVNWYREAVPGDIRIDPNLITVSSDVFQIRATASLNNRQLTTDVIVRREQDKSGKLICRVIRWRTE